MSRLSVAWVQLSQICVALPGCLDICQTQLCPAALKGGSNVAWFERNLGAGDVQGENAVSNNWTGAPLVHIYSYVCHENRHATFILCKPYQLDCKRIEYCISNYVAVEQYVFYSATTDKMATLRHSSLMLLDSSFELRLISSCYAVRTSCFHESQGFGLQLRPLFTIVISHYSFDGI